MDFRREEETVSRGGVFDMVELLEGTTLLKHCDVLCQSGKRYVLYLPDRSALNAMDRFMQHDMGFLYGKVQYI